MNHELPANMPVILKRVTGEESVKMVGTEGLLAGGLDKLVNELQGDEFQVSPNNVHLSPRLPTHVAGC